MINHITMLKGNNKVTYHVFYKNKKVTYTENDNLPNTVLMFILNSEDSETKITNNGTVTYFR